MSSKRFDKLTLRRWSNLSEWSEPDAFAAQVEEIRVTPGFREAVFKQAGLVFFRDAWVAGRVATYLRPKRVRLCSNVRPDFELDLDGEIKKYEVTEADEPGRKRGDEPIKSVVEPDPVEAWRERFEAIRPAVTAVIVKKTKKLYAADTQLVIYVNLGCYGAYLDEGIEVLRNATEPAKDHFREVFTYWEGNLYRFWTLGKSDFRSWTPNSLEEIDDWP
jgi:hypothetical protein